MAVNPTEAVKMIDSLLLRIDEISKKEYAENGTIKEFAELVFEIIRFVRLSVKGIKERTWALEYYDFTCWSKEGVKVGRMLDDDDTEQQNDRWTIGEAYEYDIKSLKYILTDCKKDFEIKQKMKPDKKSPNTVITNIKKKVFVKEFLPMVGKWDLHDNIARYVGPDEGNNPFPHGVALINETMKNGVITTTVRFEENGGRTARIIYGYHNDSKIKSYYSIGIGGYDYAFVIDIFKQTPQGIGWQGLALEGKISTVIKPNKDYNIELSITGTKTILKIDGIQIFNYNVPEPPKGDQLGIFTWGSGGASFKDLCVSRIEPKAFVIMRFCEPFDTLYKTVIKKVCEGMGINAYRADEVYKPGVILTDIIKGIEESEILIADITTGDDIANVYYELGYAHALKKSTILLAKKGCKLPFDVQGYRIIFYEDVTGNGEKDFKNELTKHLENVLHKVDN
jgi:hypothetical protein